MTLNRADAISLWTSPSDAAREFRHSGWNAHDVRMRTLRLKSASDAVLALEVSTAPGADFIPVMLRIGMDPDLDVIESKWATLHPVPSALGAGILRVPGALALSWPNDLGLRSLRHVADLDRFKRLLAELPAVTEGRYRVRGSKSSLEILRWKPERRVVGRACLACVDDATKERVKKVVFVRVWPDERGRDLLKILALLQPMGLPIPKPMGELLDGTVSVESSVRGRGFFEEFLRAPSLNAAERLGRLLGRLHSIPADHARPSTFDLLQGASDLIAVEAPSLVTRFTSLQSAVGDVPRGNRWVHGDLHLRQILISDDDLGLVDFERAGSGSPEVDMGLLLANLDDLAMRTPHAAAVVMSFAKKIVQVWSDALGGHDADKLRDSHARGLLGLAMLPLRRCEPLALQMADERITAAEQVLSARGARPSIVRGWISIYPKPKSPWAAQLDDGSSAIFDPKSRTLTEVRLANDPIMASHADLLTTGRAIAHRAHSRVVFETTSSPPTFVKIVARKRGRDLALRIRETERLRSEFGIEFPRLVASDPEHGRFEFAQLKGTPWHDELMRGEFARHAKEVALAIGALHAVKASPALPSAHRPTTEEILEFVAEGAPEHLVQFTRSARHLPATPTTKGESTLHGDLHDRNILIFESSVRFLDPDSIRSGVREEDEANLSAHVVLRALMIGKPVQAAVEFGNAFESLLVDSKAPGRQELRVAFRYHTFFRLAAIHLFRKPWSYLAPSLLAAAAGSSSSQD